MSNADTAAAAALATLTADRGADEFELVPTFGIALSSDSINTTFSEATLEDAKRLAAMLRSQGQTVALRRIVTGAEYRAQDSDSHCARNVSFGLCPDGCCGSEAALDARADETDRRRRVAAAFRAIGSRGAARFA